MAPPHSVWKGPTAGDVGPYNGKLESQASYEETLPVPPMGSDTGDVNDDVDEEAPEEAYALYPMTTYAGDPALALKVVTFPAGQAGGNVHHLLQLRQEPPRLAQALQRGAFSDGQGERPVQEGQRQGSDAQLERRAAA